MKYRSFKPFPPVTANRGFEKFDSSLAANRAPGSNGHVAPMVGEAVIRAWVAENEPQRAAAHEQLITERERVEASLAVNTAESDYAVLVAAGITPRYVPQTLGAEALSAVK